MGARMLPDLPGSLMGTRLRTPRREAVSSLVALAGRAFGSDASEIEAALQSSDEFDVVEMLWEVEEALREQGY